MKSKPTEEKKLNLNQMQNLPIKKIKINKKNCDTVNILPHTQSQFNLYDKNNNKNKKIATKVNKLKTISVDSINLRTFNLLYNSNNNLRKIHPIKSELFKVRKINKISEANKTNYNFNLYKPSLKNSNTHKTNENINESAEHKLLYEDIIKLKTKINKLKMELSFLKSLNRKKEEEIRELEKNKEEAKYYQGKNDNKIFFKKLNYLKEIVRLKNIYEEIKIKLRNQKDLNNNILNQIKSLDIAELKNKNEENLKILKQKVEEFNKLRKINEELEQEIQDSDWFKKKFMENHKFLTNLRIDLNKILDKIKILKEKSDKLKEKSESINSKKDRMIRRNSSIESDNQKLLKERKAREDYVMKQLEIQKQITSYENLSQTLMNQTSEKEQNIQDISQKRKFKSNFKFKPYLEANPNDNKKKQVTLYESLILESKKKQNEFVDKILDLIEENDEEINDNNNKNKIVIKIQRENIIKDKNLEKGDNDNDNSQIFENNTNINAGIKDINIEENDEKIIENNNNNNELIFILNMMFYIKKVKKDKIKNILLNFKTENYFVATLKEKNSFLINLSTEILQTIDNQSDINNLKEVLLYILENKYKEDNVLFLNESINDIFILEDNTKILFNLKEERNLLQQLEKIISEKDVESIVSKLKNTKNKTISYDNLKSLFNEEKIFTFSDNNENIKFFQFFIYIMKKNENTLIQKNSLKEFNLKKIMEFFDNLKPKENKPVDEFITALKKFLKIKNTTLENLLGKNDFIDTTEIINILVQNEFKNENVNLDLYYYLQKYQTEDNIGKIDINSLKYDLDNI